MSEFVGWRKNNNIDFGDLVKIEMHRYGAPNEFYIHKVIGSFESNAWVEVPVKWDKEAKIHNHVEKVLNVICCGVDETKVYTVRECDCNKIEQPNPLQQEVERLREENRHLNLKYQFTPDEIQAALHKAYVEKLNMDIAKLREALEFYADTKTYFPQEDNVCSHITMDYGAKARQALGLEGSS